MSAHPESMPADRLRTLVRDTPWLMALLRAAREADLPDWAIGAGVVRDLVWDHLHGRALRAPPADVDLVFHDPRDLSPAREALAEARLAALRPDVAWEATNQAAVHLWFARTQGRRVPPLGSTTAGIATWPETATAVAVRLEPDDGLTVLAPCGLDDLFGLVCRPNPRCPNPEAYAQRIVSKRFAARWPGLTLLMD